jgi:hypothetical protein
VGSQQIWTVTGGSVDLLRRRRVGWWARCLVASPSGSPRLSKGSAPVTYALGAGLEAWVT